jgi:cation transport regulator ChaB
MSKLQISHHERVPGHPHRWHVHLHDREKPLVVELPPEEREGLDMSDEEIHQLLPTALRRREESNRDDTLPGDEADDVAWDAPVRVYQTHFMG